jgi:hypothetical protein
VLEDLQVVTDGIELNTTIKKVAYDLVTEQPIKGEVTYIALKIC